MLTRRQHPLPTTSCTQFRTSAPRACARTPNLLISRLLCNPLRSQLWSRLIRTPSPLPRAELPLSIHYADLLQGQPLSTSLSREEPALAPIEPVHQATIMAAEVRANGDAAAASKTEWYAGATRFELELEVRYDIPRENAPPHSQYATVTSLTPTPVRPIPLKPLLPAPPLRAKVLRGRRFCRMVQVPEILRPA